MKLKGKVALVTGAASGMGRAISLRFAKEGAYVALVDIDRQGGHQLEHLIRDTGGEALYIPCDVSKRDEAREAVAATVRRYGKLHILVNDAGIMDPGDGLVENITEETWDRVMGINLKGAFYFCKFAIPEIVTCGGGTVLNIASTAGLTATDWAAYGSSKGALISFTRVVARQFGPKKVRCVAICPGPIDTNLTKKTRAARAQQGDHRPMVAPLIIERIGQPEEVASAALFLASDDGSFMTASVFPVDGGRSAM